MDFREARFDIGPHHRARLGHGFKGGPRLPGIGTEMIATKYDVARIDCRFRRQSLDESAEG